ncbi:hypothetical protein [Pontibacillus marinus]|uniref:Uncharacterized protein n=1 Tax=Pontibacillus marinus BH030004 = DSM 16465 TaxID=1385511 RepID=A0A0A5GFN1_9BACI|nr:hypothetical protein [Pontibacillus marinus]KGX89935.1 hypothetical protein N783_03140 [Pontibacillus marinus BH030004 = DSM 16465]
MLDLLKNGKKRYRYDKGASDQTAELAGDQIRSFLEQAGFEYVRVHHRPGKPNKTTCVVGSAP